jgi:hypothetical protein
MANRIAIRHAAHHGREKRIQKDGTELDDRKDGKPETELNIVQAIPHLHKRLLAKQVTRRVRRCRC